MNYSDKDVATTTEETVTKTQTEQPAQSDATTLSEEVKESTAAGEGKE